MIKSFPIHFEAISKLIRASHNYECPPITAHSLTVIDPDYRNFEYSPKIAFNAGIGLKIFFNRWFAAVLEVRDYIFLDELENLEVAELGGQRRRRGGSGGLAFARRRCEETGGKSSMRSEELLGIGEELGVFVLVTTLEEVAEASVHEMGVHRPHELIINVQSASSIQHKYIKAAALGFIQSAFSNLCWVLAFNYFQCCHIDLLTKYAQLLLSGWAAGVK